MGCRHSRSDELDDPNVESIHYRKRSSIWKLARGKKHKKSNKSSSSNQTARSARGAADAEDVDVGDGVGHGHGGDGDAYVVNETASRTSPTPSDKSPVSSSITTTTTTTTTGQKSNNKNTNERMHIFGDHQNSVKNHLCLSVDNNMADLPDAAVEPKNSKFGHASVFPIWESSFSEPCKCSINTTDVNQAPPPPPSSDEIDRRDSSQSSTNSRLCRRCSQTVENVQNNLRNVGISSSNANSNNNTGVGSGGVGGAQDTINTDGSGSGNANNNISSSSSSNQLAAIANLLVLAALDLSAPASSLLVKNRKNAWIQLAGHPGAFAPAGPNTIWKKRISKENYETLAYQALSDFPNTRSIMPAFYREVEFNGEYFIEMEDLLQHFNDPSIMDIKMGHRTFLEAEVKNPVLRKDLFEKMVKLDPDAPTEEEKAEGAITKLRYMQFREHESSTANLGFRIEAIRMSGDAPNTNLKKVKSKEEVSYFIQAFTKGHECVIPTLWERLKEIRETFESIPFFHTHEIIGSSLLIMFDSSNHSGAWMIDFAKTIPVPDVRLNHRSSWQLGNHEDGYLFGLDNLIRIFGDLSEQQEK